MFIDGQFVKSKAVQHFKVINPVCFCPSFSLHFRRRCIPVISLRRTMSPSPSLQATQETVGLVPQCTDAELQAAAASAAAAFPAWRNTPLTTRQVLQGTHSTLNTQYDSNTIFIVHPCVCLTVTVIATA